MADWDEIDLTSFKRAQETTTDHMAHFITKCMSNTLTTTMILQQQGSTTTNLCSLCVITLEMIQHIYQFTHKVIRDRWTASVDALHKCLEAWNTDPGIAIILANALLYITGEKTT